MTATTLGGWLVHVMRAADSALSLEESLHALMESMGTYFPCQSVAVLLIDEDTKELRIKISRRLSYTFSKKFRQSGPSPTAERIVLEQTPLLVAEADPASPLYAELKLEHEYRSAVVSPVVTNRRGVGYVFCDRAGGDPAFTQSDLLHLQVIGLLIGNLIEKFDLIRDSKRLSQTDDATGVMQYKAFVPALAVEFERAVTHAYPVSLALVAVEAFRKYVETYGIDRAHALLANATELIKRHLTAMDLVARFGADEFVLCLSSCGREDASRRLADIRADVRAHLVAEADSPSDVAIGALTLTGRDEMSRSMQDILGSLGGCLMQAKGGAGGRIVCGALRPAG
jgi:diguanylate cyclase (GGDEF)-like protein